MIRLLAVAATVVLSASGCSLLFDENKAVDGGGVNDERQSDDAHTGEACSEVTVGPFVSSSRMEQVATVDYSVPQTQCARVLVVLVSWRSQGGSDVVVDEALFDGAPLSTFGRAGSNPTRNQFFYVVAPPTGTANISIEFESSGISDGGPGAIASLIVVGTVSGVDADGPIQGNGQASEQSQAGTPTTVPTTGNTDQRVLLGFSLNDASLNAQSPAVEVWNDENGNTVRSIGAWADGPNPTFSIVTNNARSYAASWLTFQPGSP